MSVAMRLPIPPELEHVETDERSVLCFEHGFPSQFVRWHCHDEFELHLIVASVGRMFVGDHIGVFEPGQLVLTGPGLPHNWISQTEEGEVIELRDLVVQFRQDLVQSMATNASELRELLPLLERARHGIHFQGTPQAKAEPWFRRIVAAKGPSRIAILLQFLDFLNDETGSVLLSTLPIRSKEDAASLDKVERAVSYMTEHYNHDVLLGDVAALADMSESAFSRLFAKATGNNFTRFLNRIRIAKACELLVASNEPITAICFEVGFNNVANFNRRFREIKNATPREYRQLSSLQHSDLTEAKSFS